MRTLSSNHGVDFKQGSDMGLWFLDLGRLWKFDFDTFYNNLGMR